MDDRLVAAAGRARPRSAAGAAARCISESARSITSSIATGSRLTGGGAAKGAQVGDDLGGLAHLLHGVAQLAQRSAPRARTEPSSIWSIALPTKRPMLLSGLFSSCATPVVSSPSVASLPAWTSCSCLSRSSCSRRSISCGGLAQVAHDVDHRLAAVLQPQVGLVRILQDVQQGAARVVQALGLVRQPAAVLLVVGEDVEHRLALIAELAVGLVQVAHDVEQRAAPLLAPARDALARRRVARARAGLAAARLAGPPFAARSHRGAGAPMGTSGRSSRSLRLLELLLQRSRAPSRARSSSARGRRPPPRTSPGRGSSPAAPPWTPRGRAPPARRRACRGGCRWRRSPGRPGRAAPRRSAWSG